MTLSDVLAPIPACDPDKAQALGERYNLDHPAEFVVTPTGTTHLRRPNSPVCLCGISIHRMKSPRFTTTGHLSCNRCTQVVERALDRKYAAKKAK